VSYTHTDALLPQATNRRWPSGETTIAFGCSPVTHESTDISESAV
jgi:hypothetical protein